MITRPNRLARHAHRVAILGIAVVLVLAVAMSVAPPSAPAALLAGSA